jgi:hypothetical protein
VTSAHAAPTLNNIVSLFVPHRRASGLLAAVLGLLACRENSGPALIPALVQNATTSELSATVGTVLLTSPTFIVRDAAGVTVAGIPVTVSVSAGGGTVLNAPSRSGAGPTSVGRWTLGTRAGQNAVTVTVSGLPPIVLTATGIAGAPAQVRAVSGTGQTVFAGATLEQPIVVEVVDQFGNGVPNVAVAFQPILGGSTFTPAAATTGADGRIPGVAWTLGVRGRTQTARAAAGALTADLTAAVRSDFSIEVRFVNEPQPAIRQIFEDAADRIRGLITGELADIVLQNFNAAGCGIAFGVLSETVDDLLILADVTNIDGPGSILGQAGPCAVRSTTRFPVIGIMRFDQSDFTNLLSSGRLEAVVLHEMLHVVGVGSLWSTRGLLVDAGTSDPRFTGPAGIARCNAAGFSSHCAVGGIPVENTGGGGTRDSHWRESIFDAELMTGFAESTPNMPLSAITAGSLEDFGYVVNYLAADPFQVPSVLQRAAPMPPAPAWDEVLRPTIEITPDGVARAVRPPVSRR